MYHDLIKKTINKLAMLDREQALPALKQLGYLCNTSYPNDISSSATFWFLEEKSVRLSQNSFRREEREEKRREKGERERERRERERERRCVN